MTTKEKEFYRITVWPGTQIPIPKVLVRSVRLDGDMLYFEPVNKRAVELPEELYLRELVSLDLANFQQIVDFTASFGWLGDTSWESLPEKDNPRIGLINLQHKQFIETNNIPESRARFHVPILIIIEHAAIIRDLVRIWDYLSSDLTTLKNVITQWENRIFSPPKNEAQAVDFLCDILTAALKPFHVRVEFNLDGVNMQEPRPKLYSALCLQLANHIAEKVPYVRCANKPCNELFVRQRGRAKYGVYRTQGVHYCSRDCANAHTQREFRRRRTEARRLYKNGTALETISKRVKAKLETVKKWVGSD